MKTENSFLSSRENESLENRGKDRKIKDFNFEIGFFATDCFLLRTFFCIIKIKQTQLKY